MKKQVLLAVTTLLSLIFITIPSVMAEEQSEQPLVIALMAPLSGDNAEYGRNFSNAIHLYLDELNADGGINGRRIEIIEADDRSDPRESTAIAQRFAGDNRVMAVIGSFASTPSMAAAPIFERAGIVQLSPSSSHPDFTGLGSYMFRNTTTQKIEAPAVADYVVNELEADRIVVVFRQDDWGLSASTEFANAAQQLGADIVLSEGFIEGERDFRPLITQIRSLNPDVIHVAMFYADAAVLAQQMASAGLDVPVVTTTSLYNPQFITLGGDAVEGYYIPANFFPGNPAEPVQAFVQKYQERWGQEPDQFAAIAYDSIAVITEAIRVIITSGEPLTRQAIRDALHDLPPYPGASGTIAFDAQGDVVKTMTWLTIENGEFMPLLNH